MLTNKYINKLIMLLLLFSVQSCMSASQHSEQLSSTKENVMGIKKGQRRVFR